MRKSNLFVLVAFLLSSVSSIATDYAHKSPCTPIKQACEKAGYYTGGKKEGKGLYGACVGPIIHGKKVENVEVTEEQAIACRDFRKHSRKRVD